MFKHHILEDIKKWSARTNDQPFKGYLDGKYSEMKSATTFFVGDIYETSNLINKYYGHEMFSGELGDVRSPFETCVFEFTDKYGPDNKTPPNERSSKRAVLAKEIEVGGGVTLAASPFWFMDQERVWTPAPFFFSIMLDGFDTEKMCDDIKTFFPGVSPSKIPNVFPLPVPTNESTAAATSWQGVNGFLGKHSVAIEESLQELQGLNAALLLLSCKNISRAEAPAPAKLNKKRAKNQREPIEKYYTLSLNLPGSTGSGPRSSEGDGGNKLHICRGHFKHYGPEKPLFGRTTGRFWWQPHARGASESGSIEKDYDIQKSFATCE